jgi:ferric-dicitrate binding protein FerR (iron transport regulator)
VTEPPDISKPDPLFDEALDWVIRLKTAAPTRAEVDASQRWREQSPAHEDAFNRAARLFRNAAIAVRELADERQRTGVTAPVPRPFARRALLGGAIAATAAYAMARPPFGLWPSIQELSADYRTAKGEHRSVTVAPNVVLELNTQTSVALRSGPDQTRIELISGEALVAARLASSMPLVMLAGHGRMTALRADFNARCIDGIVSVTCLEGAVTVDQDGQAVQLRGTEQVTYSFEGIQAAVPVDAVQVSSWRVGLLIVRDRPLASVVDEVNRYRAGKIIITNAELGRRLVNGTFQLGGLANFVTQVEQLFGARVTSLPGGVVLLS